jgi:hypothetical protein
MIADSESSWRRAQNWALIAGRWECENADAHYLGPGGGIGPLGIALTDVRAVDSTVRLKATFETLGSTARDASAGVILGYAGQEAGYVMVSIGGWEAAYSLGEYAPAFGWRATAKYGSLENLRPNQDYRVEVMQRGQKVTLAVDDVRVFEHVLSAPLPGNQVGLFAWGSDRVWFRDVQVLESKPKLFVAMPFLDRLAPLYEDVIRPRAETEGFEVVRIDEMARPGIIFQDIQHEIADATAVVAEISGPNSNVFYELGYAHALNKPTILLAQRGQDLPFDIRSYRVIFYDDTIGGKPALEDTLARHLSAILHET